MGLTGLEDSPGGSRLEGNREEALLWRDRAQVLAEKAGDRELIERCSKATY